MITCQKKNYYNMIIFIYFRLMSLAVKFTHK